MSEPSAELLCSLCMFRGAHPGSSWCGGCFARVWTELGELAFAHWWLGRTIETPAPAWKSSSIHAGGGSRPPFRVDLTDVRTQIAQLLTGYARLIGHEHTPPLAGPANHDPATIVRWLRARLPWASEHQWDDFAIDVVELRALAHATAPWERSRRDLALRCPACGLLSLSLYSGDEWAACRNRACGRMVPPNEYRELLAEGAAAVHLDQLLDGINARLDEILEEDRDDTGRDDTAAADGRAAA